MLLAMAFCLRLRHTVLAHHADPGVPKPFVSGMHHVNKRACPAKLPGIKSGNKSHLLSQQCVYARLSGGPIAQSCMTNCTSNYIDNKQHSLLNIYAGEIIPQALCKSYALLIGNYCAGMVRVLCYAVGIISWPISKVLDYVLGDEHTVRPQLHFMSAVAGYHIHCHLIRGLSDQLASQCTWVVLLMRNTGQLLVY